MNRLPIVALILMCSASGALAQQNQVPGDTGSGGNSRAVSGSATAAQAAQSGANTSDATTTGASGPSGKQSAAAAGIALPPLPSDKLCSSYEGEVRDACLSTDLNTRSGATP